MKQVVNIWADTSKIKRQPERFSPTVVVGKLREKFMAAVCANENPLDTAFLPEVREEGDGIHIFVRGKCAVNVTVGRLTPRDRAALETECAIVREEWNGPRRNVNDEEEGIQWGIVAAFVVAGLFLFALIYNFMP